MNNKNAHYLAPIRRSAIRNGLIPGLFFTGVGIFFFYGSYLMNGPWVALITPPGWIGLGLGILCLVSAWQDFAFRVDDFGQAPLTDAELDALFLIADRAVHAAPAYSGKLGKLGLGPKFPPSVVCSATRSLDQSFERQRVQVSAGVTRAGQVSLVYHLEDVALLDRGGISADLNEAADSIAAQMLAGEISKDQADAAFADAWRRFN